MVSEQLVAESAGILPRDALLSALNADGDVRFEIDDLPSIGAACVLCANDQTALSCSIWIDRNKGWRCDVVKRRARIEPPSVIALRTALPWHQILWGESGEARAAGEGRDRFHATFNQMTRRIRRLAELLRATRYCDPLRLSWPPEIVDRMVNAHVLDAESLLLEIVRIIRRHVGVLEMRELGDELAKHVEYLAARRDHIPEAPDGSQLVLDFVTNVNAAIAERLNSICLMLAVSPAFGWIASARPNQFFLSEDDWNELIGMPINLELAVFGLLRDRVAHLPPRPEGEVAGFVGLARNS